MSTTESENNRVHIQLGEKMKVRELKKMVCERYEPAYKVSLTETDENKEVKKYGFQFDPDKKELLILVESVA